MINAPKKQELSEEEIKEKVDQISAEYELSPSDAGRIEHLLEGNHPEVLTLLKKRREEEQVYEGVGEGKLGDRQEPLPPHQWINDDSGEQAIRRPTTTEEDLAKEKKEKLSP